MSADQREDIRCISDEVDATNEADGDGNEPTDVTIARQSPQKYSIYTLFIDRIAFIFIQ